MTFGTLGTFGTRGYPQNQSLARLRELRGETPPALEPAPACTSCNSPLFLPADILCPTCYQARRAPGRVLPFDPGRRARTLDRLAAHPCPDCQKVAWHVNARGDATCQTCARRRAGDAR
ncbi:MAG: hypothetical protein KBB14_05465 [Thermoanaerobaculia bacterium]|nr:hypothetical protein [Thermoanaerobaculia bacterium]